ncbi:MAG: redox-sensing transcriptional repressor Rex [Deltaproteobacteria bacterium]|nr:redox-sensing transcriptional repressor Rex [Candidatus Anaeroferrophillus wilburensis]
MKQKEVKIPEATIKRLSTYINCLERLDDEGFQVVSSELLGDSCQISPAQIRKDLSYFGEFGVRGVGYDTKELAEQIKIILGLDIIWPTVLVGVGHLGQALLNFTFFRIHGFRMVAAFDSDPRKIGTEVTEGVIIQSVDELAETTSREKAMIGIVTVPAQYAQGTADLLVKGGVTGILNFAPFKVKVPEHVTMRNVSILSELDNLAYLLSSKHPRRRRQIKKNR